MPKNQSRIKTVARLIPLRPTMTEKAFAKLVVDVSTIQSRCEADRLPIRPLFPALIK